MIELKSLSAATGCRIFAKCEHMNPGQSVKDRAARQMVLEAEKEGRLKPGGIIVEATGGTY
jgi:cysteine synthase A